MRISNLVLIFLFFINVMFSQAIKVADSDGAQVETPIAVNPTNPDNLVGAAINIYQIEDHPGEYKRIDIYYSFDRGSSWTVIENISGEGGADPVVAFDSDGVVYLIYQKRSVADLYIHRSTDGGINWTALGTIIDFNPDDKNLDRPWMVISPYRNVNDYFDIYVAITTNNEVDNPVLIEDYDLRMLKSSDGGNSFSNVYTKFGLNQGVTLAAGPGEDGKDIAFAFGVNDEYNQLPAIEVKHYFDGVSFENNVSYTIDKIGNKDNMIKRDKIKADSYPRMSVDPYRGDYYIVWANNNTDGYSDIKLIKGKKETDGSVTWQNKGFIITGTGHQFNPSISVSQDGIVSVLYYSTTNESDSPVYTYLVKSTNGGNSFGSRVTLGEANGFTLGDNGFLGDYHGLASWFNEAFAFFCQRKSHGAEINDRQVYFHKRAIPAGELADGFVNVTVDQKDAAGNSFGQFDRWNQGKYTSYTAPINLVFKENNDEVIKAMQTFKTNTYEKYSQWNNIVDIKNHKSFIVDDQISEVISIFKNAYNTTIYVNLLSGGSGAEIEFKDPWFVDTDDEQYNDPPYGYRNLGMDMAEFRSFVDEVNLNQSSKYKGISLNQDPETDPAYYSIRAKAVTILPFHGQDVTWNFIEWQDNGKADIVSPTQIITDAQTGIEYYQTPVVFTDNNAEVTAVYKGHLASNNSRATGYNNGRRLARSGSDFYLVYEDGGKIWYTHSADNGETWDKEVLLAAPGAGAFCVNPAITYYPEKLFVTWAECYESGQNTDHFVVWYAEKDLSSPSADWLKDVVYPEELCELSEILPAPVIAIINLGGTYHPIIVYDHNRNNSPKIRGFERIDNFWFEIGDLDLGGSHPGLSADTYHQINNEYLGLVYDHNGVIYLKTCYNQNGAAVWEAAETVSQQTSWIINQSHPNLSLKNTHAHVTWEAFNTRSGNWEVKYREYMPGSSAMYINANNTPVSPYNVVTTFSSNVYDLHHPTLGSDEVHNVSVYYQKTYQDSRQILNKQYNASSSRWHSYYYEGGQYPSMADHRLEGCIWTKYNEAPFLLKSDVAGPSSNIPVDPITKPIGPVINSVLNFTFVLEPAENNGQTGYITCSIDNTIFNGDPLIFNDSLYTDSLVAEISLLPLDLEMRVFYENVHIPLNAQEILFKVEFMDQNQNIHMTQFKYHELPDSGSFVKSVSVANLHYREGRVRIKFPQREPLISYNFEYWDEGLPKKDFSEVQEYIPENYFISQNFPNPFNPFTHITFGLPRTQDVALTVFDIRGRKVKNLIDGVRKAGMHEVVFDGSALPSGVYFYRLSTEHYTATRRMLLIK